MNHVLKALLSFIVSFFRTRVSLQIEILALRHQLAVCRQSIPRSPWQNPYVERLIGSIRRECLDHMIVLNERHLHKILKSYFDDYHRSRVHQSLDMDCPEPRPVQEPNIEPVVEIPQVGGLHH